MVSTNVLPLERFHGESVAELFIIHKIGQAHIYLYRNMVSDQESNKNNRKTQNWHSVKYEPVRMSHMHTRAQIRSPEKTPNQPCFGLLFVQ